MYVWAIYLQYYFFRRCTPLKFQVDTKNDALEKMDLLSKAGYVGHLC